LETPNIRTLIKAGFHFGHRTSRWNPKMGPYIFKRRNQIHIIDLRATLRNIKTVWLRPGTRLGFFSHMAASAVTPVSHR
jgi:hypothetical protein